MSNQTQETNWDVSANLELETDNRESRPYHSPRLIGFGDIIELTKSSGTGEGDPGGGSGNTFSPSTF